MIELTTDRLRVRPFTDADAPAVLDIHRHPALSRFIPSAVCATLDDARRLISRLGRYDLGPLFGVNALEMMSGPASGAVVGLIMLKPIPPSGRGLASAAAPAPDETWDTEIGWRVHPQFEGYGLIAEAARAALAHAFAHGLDRVVAVTNPDNLASQRVARRIGMREAGLSRAYYDTECALFEAPAPRVGEHLGS